jgi:hypothetical protein
VVVIVWSLDLKLPVQSVSITIKVVSSNHVQDEVCSIQHYVIKFVSDLRHFFLGTLVSQLPWFPLTTETLPYSYYLIT